MKILGIDPSLNSTGVCILNNGVIELLATLHSPGTLTREAKLQLLYDRMYGIADGLIADRDVAVIEGYAFGSKFQRETMGEVSGVIRLVLSQVGIPCTAIPPASWQKQLLGRVVVKDLRAELLLKKFHRQLPGYWPKNMDEIEAWAVAYARWERYTGAYIAPPTSPKNRGSKAKS